MDRTLSIIGISAVLATLLVGIAGAQGTLQSPGYGQSNVNGACRGVFGSYFGTVVGGLGYISTIAPLGDQTGANNANGEGCPYLGTTNGLPFPLGSSAAGANPNSP